MSKTIKEIKNNKSKLEADILSMLIDFEKENEIKVNYANVTTDRHSYEEEEQTRKQKKKLRKLKGVLDVTIDVNIENDPRSIDVPAQEREI